jgi:hypothetical protein
MIINKINNNTCFPGNVLDGYIFGVQGKYNYFHIILPTGCFMHKKHKIKSELRHSGRQYGTLLFLLL